MSNNYIGKISNSQLKGYFEGAQNDLKKEPDEAPNYMAVLAPRVGGMECVKGFKITKDMQTSPDAIVKSIVAEIGGRPLDVRAIYDLSASSLDVAEIYEAPVNTVEPV